MHTSKSIVCVSASFAKGPALQAILNKYAQHSDRQFAYWGPYAFTADLLPSCDALLVFNTPAELIRVQCDPGKVIAFMMEPGYEHEHPWMFRHLGQYTHVYSPLPGTNTVPSHGYLGWYPDMNYPALNRMPIPVKHKSVSCIASGLSRLPGHRERLAFVKALAKQFPQVDCFGRPARYLPNKMDGLLPYRYSIALENTSRPHYFTEKINDCFLAYTVPVYYGCTNIGAYFPEKSFIQVDITNPHTAWKKIAALQDDDWESRLPAVKEARQLVLEVYQPLAGAAGILRESQKKERSDTVLHPVNRNFTDRIKTRLHNPLSRHRFFFFPRKQASQPS